METTRTQRLPYQFAAQYGLCFFREQEQLCLAYKAGLQVLALAEARRFAGEPLKAHLVTSDEFEHVLAAAYSHESGSAQKFAEDAGEALSLSHAVDSVAGNGDLLAQEDDAPIIRLINALLMEALRESASDIHIETFEKILTVRLRVDGILRETLKLQPSLAPILVSRIKVMAQLDIAEKRLPQDGRMSLRIGGREVDVRVSVMPAGSGERVVLRLLDKQAGRLDVGQLGLSTANMTALQSMMQRPHGIILVTGPTGSGKTTSLYAVLTQLNDRTRNILTVEDPVEYQIEGIGQTQVNPRVDLTFARGLRAILRQDPDIVMVGEIRDVETASVAVQASLTGHLVLSTLHTNSAVGAVIRLIDMGVESFLLSSSLVGLIAQRLVRALCLTCRVSYKASPKECSFLEVPLSDPPSLHRAKGCQSCHHTGFNGRVAIYEIVAVDEGLKALIHAESSEHALESYARAQSPGIAADGKNKILRGVTSVDEVMRVINE